MKSKIAAAIVVAGLVSAGPASADLVSIDFEGPASNAPIGNFYAASGVVFGQDALAFRNDIPEFPTFSNAPSPIGVMSPVNADATMNVAPGFSGAVSLYYSSSVASTVSIWSGLDGTGTQLGIFNLGANAQANCSDSPFCNWQQLTLNIGAIAHSITFGDAIGAGFDNVAISTVPLPAALPLLGFGLAGMGTLVRRRKKAGV